MSIGKNETQIEDNKAPKGLFRAIIRRIGLEKTLVSLKRKVTFSEIAFSSGIVVFAFLVFVLAEEVIESGFFVYLSLFLSDSKFAFRYWSDLSFSTLESIPGLEISLSLLFLSLVLFMVKIIAKYFYNISQVNSKIDKTLKYNGYK